MAGKETDPPRPISGPEFRNRRIALNLTERFLENKFEAEAKADLRKRTYSRSTIMRWQQADSQVPFDAGDLLDRCEIAVQDAIEHFVELRNPLIDPDMPKDWEWGHGAWSTAIARARFILQDEHGIDARIGDPAPPTPRRYSKPRGPYVTKSDDYDSALERQQRAAARLAAEKD